MKSQLAYKLSIDIVKNLTKNQDNIKKIYDMVNIQNYYH